MKTYTCKECGAPLKFVPGTNKLICSYCKTEYSPYDLIDLDNINFDEEYDSLSDNTEINTYLCPSCDGEILCTTDTLSTICPYCGTPISLDKKLKSEISPHYCIPFKITENQAEQTFYKFQKSRTFASDSYRNSKIRSIQGFYIPYYLYSFNTQTKVKLLLENNRNAYVKAGSYTKFYPICGSNKLDLELINAISPFNYDDLMPFTPSYLAGYMTEHCNYDNQEMIQFCHQSVEQHAINQLPWEIKEAYKIIDKKSDFSKEKRDNLMVPLWIVHSQYNNKYFYTYINGQTGETSSHIGDAPLAKYSFYALYFPLFVSLFLILCHLHGV